MSAASFVLQIADVRIGVQPLTDRLARAAHRYVADPSGDVDFSVEITENDVAEESEWLALQRKITERIIDFDVILVHASVVSIDGCGYAYLGKSGTGKSTHTRLIREVYGDRAVMINDDKPFVRVIDGDVYAFGTPWCGKHNLETPDKVLLRGLCFLHQAEENSIREMKGFESFTSLFPQVYKHPDKNGEEKTLAIIETMLSKVKCYSMNCNMEHEAAKLSVRTMARYSIEELLKRDGEITYRTVGNSMAPMLTENKDVVIIRSVDVSEIKRYDVVLYKRPNDLTRYILHRVMRVKKNRFDIVGDNRNRMERNVPAEWILGVLTSYIHDGNEIPVDDPEYRKYVRKTVKSYPKRFVKGLVRAAGGRLKRLLQGRRSKK